jgi:hypothetical protein
MARVYADTPALRATGKAFKDASTTYEALARELRGHPLPVMPTHVDGRVRGELHAAGARVQALSTQAWADGGMMVTTASEFERAADDDGFAATITALEGAGKLTDYLGNALVNKLTTPERLRMKQWVSAPHIEGGGYWRRVPMGQRAQMNWSKAMHPSGWQHVKAAGKTGFTRGVSRVTLGLNFVVPFATQTLEDWDNPTLSNRDVAARAVLSAGLVGGGSALGGRGGAMLGASIGAAGGPPGVVAGAIIGYVVGSQAGGWVGEQVKNKLFKKLWG